MSIESEFYSRVKDAAAVAAVISGRMYPLVVSHDADRPYIAYARTSTEDAKIMSGSGGHRVARFRLTCWSLDYDTTLDLATKVRAAIDNFSHGAWGGETVQRCFVVDESDELEPSPELYEQRALGRNLDIEIVYTV